MLSLVENLLEISPTISSVNTFPYKHIIFIL